MFINEAVTLALAKHCCIKRTCGCGWKYCKVKPSDSIDKCLLEIQRKPDEKPRLIPRWQPNAADLLADDWVIVP